jgi:SAM-dependent methyltransferase
MFRSLRFDLAYLFRPPWDTGVSPPELLDYVAAHAPGRAVDLGCGSGTNIVTLGRNGWEVTGVDLSTWALRLARQKLDQAGLAAALLPRDLSKTIEPLGPFDLALDIGCFHAVTSRRRYLDNLVSMLRRGGHWLMYGFIRTEGTQFGVDELDVSAARSRGLRLTSRTDGFERKARPSAWFQFEKVP